MGALLSCKLHQGDVKQRYPHKMVAENSPIIPSPIIDSTILIYFPLPKLTEPGWQGAGHMISECVCLPARNCCCVQAGEGMCGWMHMQYLPSCSEDYV